MINLHPSLLPLYPGLNTHDQVLTNKDSFHGISIHYVSPKLDGGPLIAQGVIKVNKNEEKNIAAKKAFKYSRINLALSLPILISMTVNQNLFS